MASASSIMIIDAIYMGHPHRRMSNGIFFVSMSPPDYNSTTPKNQQFKAESIKDNQTCFLFGRLEEQNLCFVENTRADNRRLLYKRSQQQISSRVIARQKWEWDAIFSTQNLFAFSPFCRYETLPSSRKAQRNPPKSLWRQYIDVKMDAKKNCLWKVRHK